MIINNRQLMEDAYINQMYKQIGKKYPFYNKKIIPFGAAPYFKQKQQNQRSAQIYHKINLEVTPLTKSHIIRLPYKKILIKPKFMYSQILPPLDKKLMNAISEGKMVYVDLNTKKTFYISNKRLKQSNPQRIAQEIKNIKSQDTKNIEKIINIDNDYIVSFQMMKQRSKQIKRMFINSEKKEESFTKKIRLKTQMRQNFTSSKIIKNRTFLTSKVNKTLKKIDRNKINT